MAIKITKKGELPEKQVFVGKCTNCRTEVEFLKEDASSSRHDQRDGLIITIACPVCPNVIYGYARKLTRN